MVILPSNLWQSSRVNLVLIPSILQPRYSAVEMGGDGEVNKNVAAVEVGGNGEVRKHLAE